VALEDAARAERQAAGTENNTTMLDAEADDDLLF